MKLQRFKDSLLIVRTGKDANGNSYSPEGLLNQAAWIGENSGWLIHRIEELEKKLKRVQAQLAKSKRSQVMKTKFIRND